MLYGLRHQPSIYSIRFVVLFSGFWLTKLMRLYKMLIWFLWNIASIAENTQTFSFVRRRTWQWTWRCYSFFCRESDCSSAHKTWNSYSVFRPSHRRRYGNGLEEIEEFLQRNFGEIESKANICVCIKLSKRLRPSATKISYGQHNTPGSDASNVSTSTDIFIQVVGDMRHGIETMNSIVYVAFSRLFFLRFCFIFMYSKMKWGRAEISTLFRPVAQAHEHEDWFSAIHSSISFMSFLHFRSLHSSLAHSHPPSITTIFPSIDALRLSRRTQNFHHSIALLPCVLCQSIVWLIAQRQYSLYQMNVGRLTASGSDTDQDNNINKKEKIQSESEKHRRGDEWIQRGM